MSCAAPTYKSVLLELNPLEGLRNTIAKLALDPIHKEFASSLLGKIEDIQKAFQILAQVDKEVFTDELAANITNTVKTLKQKLVEEESDVEVTSSSFYLIISVFTLISILVTFGYKLYKSLMEKQKKREQKLKAKSKKKK